MRPSRFLLRALLAWLAAGLLVFAARVYFYDSANQTDLLGAGASIVDTLEKLWWFFCGYLMLVGFFDAFRHRSYPGLIISRNLPHSLALGVHSQVSIQLENTYPFAICVDITELLPNSIIAADLPLSLTIAANSHKTLHYPVLPIKRGEAAFNETCLRILSRWKLWERIEKRGKQEIVKVYPNFAPIANSAAIGLEHQIAQLGIHLQQRRGEGSDFHQLREFREGDSLRQIDWKATARYRKPISREYQDERDQDIVFLLDCGRRLRNKDDQLSHFDHALNALLLTGYVALRQGDAVGLLSFAGSERWLTPLKGPARINLILNQLYDLHSTTDTSDYLKAAEEFLQKNQKRSLVILITNVREEDLEDLATACQLLSRRHIVMVASLRDVFLDKFMAHPVSNFNEALNYCGISDYVLRRRRMLSKLQGMGVIITDSLPHNLHLDLVNEYFKLKRSGRL
ncbi:uncharacterized protein (DUF58 family) [Alteromonadaceae bacterium 2753L.S.0a.02]|nr:uncharacterized protein (DUF58 family) [Alteromonadaceae bacterium 2753L.S.0a.02]